ncbi:acetyl/propionyl/methylcrotonyl-CoA carboxylase subunit alpha [Microterricola viridarii]|nr:biotin carboxylase N-terminal domain-containing protein [Microterricola viridarii]
MNTGHATSALPPFRTVLVANRGEIACRVIATLQRLGIEAVAVYSDADRGAKHVALADLAIRIGPAPAAESYLNVDAVMAAVRASGADAVHPGYGFLSESPLLAAACAKAGVVFVGPGEEALRVMGDKIRSKRHVAGHGVPVTPGSEGHGSEGGVDSTDDAALAASAELLGYPVLIKPSAGGGGKGMHLVDSPEALPAALASARRTARAAFGDDTLFLEKFIAHPRHIEVQLLADGAGHTVHLGERECSLQRRQQKVVEEAPSPLLDAATRARIGEAACAVARSVGYVGAGTVEFLISDAAPDEFYFMEMNTRLQVEHPVTELVTGIDIVEWQLRVAAGQELPWRQEQIRLDGHAVEARIYAEDPASDFLPTSGRVLALAEAHGPGVRVDSSLLPGGEIGSHYDPMLAKVIAWAPDRASALARLDAALAHTVILGVDTNLAFLRGLLADPAVQAGALDTGLIARHLDAQATKSRAAAARVPGARAAAAQPAPPTDTAPAPALLGEMLAVAGALLHAEAPAAAGSPWQDRSGWRTGGAAAARPEALLVRHRGERAGAQAETAFEVRVVARSAGADHTAGGMTDHLTEHLAVAVRERGAEDGRMSAHTVSIAPAATAPSRATGVHVGIAVDGVQRRWSWARDGEDLLLSVEGESTRFTAVSREAELQGELARILAARAEQEGGVAASPELRTPTPGTVVQLHAASGDAVAAGAPIATVEAMKMEHQVTASVAGTVRLHVRLGDALRRDQLLASIDAQTPGQRQEIGNE